MCFNKNMFSNECVFMAQYKLVMRSVQGMRLAHNSHTTELKSTTTNTPYYINV